MNGRVAGEFLFIKGMDCRECPLVFELFTSISELLTVLPETILVLAPDIFSASWIKHIFAKKRRNRLFQRLWRGMTLGHC
jgi:hypothetical protein